MDRVKLDELFNEHRPQLGDNDLYIWNYIAPRKRACARLSIEELAGRCNVSRTTILRFAQKLGLQGYSELKLLMRMELDEQQGQAPDYIGQACDAYRQMMDAICQKDCTDLFRQIDQAENLYVFSSGMLQDAVARELCRVFLVGDRWFFHIHAGSEADVLLQNVTSRDLVLILSVSGESPHVLSLAQALKVRGIPVVSVTRLRENTLAQLCDTRLYVSTIEMTEQELGAQYQSTTSFFILIELLFLKYMEYRKEAAGRDAGNADRAELP